MKKASLRDLLRRVHEDEKGAVSLETILIIGAIALPILIFLLTVGWPRIRDLFFKKMKEIEGEADNVSGGTGGSGGGLLP